MGDNSYMGRQSIGSVNRRGINHGSELLKFEAGLARRYT